MLSGKAEINRVHWEMSKFQISLLYVIDRPDYILSCCFEILFVKIPNRFLYSYSMLLVYFSLSFSSFFNQPISFSLPLSIVLYSIHSSFVPLLFYVSSIDQSLSPSLYLSIYIYIYIYIGPSISFQTCFCTGIFNCRKLLTIQYIIAIHLMR